MARTVDTKKFDESKERLLNVGLSLFFSNGSVNATGINKILKEASIPKGSFYHYFEDKNDFLKEVILYYNSLAVARLSASLSRNVKDPKKKLKDFFASVIKDYEENEYHFGCFLGNSGQEMSDVDENIRSHVRSSLAQWDKLIEQTINDIREEDSDYFKSLTSLELAMFIISCWEGALLRMKIEKSKEPLQQFMKIFFK
jgi:TetR/AcrR family transcriptional repressor of nem operon